MVEGDTNKYSDVFLRDLHAESTVRVSVSSDGEEGNYYSWHLRPIPSSDGRYVVFGSSAGNLIDNDQNSSEPFLRDVQVGSTTAVAVDAFGKQANDTCYLSWIRAMTPDARRVAFMSEADNLVPDDTNGVTDTFVRDLVQGTTTRVSVSSSGEEGNDRSWLGDPSANGRYVAFASGASNLVDGDQNGCFDIFVHDLWTRETSRVSVDSLGGEGDGDSLDPAVSADGRFVAFASYAENLVPGDRNKAPDVFIHDRRYRVTTLVSRSDDGAVGNGPSYVSSISNDGRYVAFSSQADNLVPDDVNGERDAFLRDRWSKASWRPYGAGWPGTHGVPELSVLGRPVLGSTIRFTLSNSSASPANACLLIGPFADDERSRWDGHWLVRPRIKLALEVPAEGLMFSVALPSDRATSGLTVYLQVAMIDPGASKGVAFSRGIQLRLGHH